MNTDEIIPFSDLEPDIQTLIKKSIAVREHAYSPYSKIKIGAAILCSNGTISTGCNVENASYPVGTCAERVAIGNAVSKGNMNFKALAVGADKIHNNFVTPCGFCRQAIAEFGDIPVYMSTPDMKNVLRVTVSNLLPYAFKLNNPKN